MNALITKTYRKIQIIPTLIIAGVIAVAPIVASTQASAAQITGRSVTVSSSAPSASASYAFNFTLPSATVVKSASFVPCTTPSGACTTPTGFSGASAVAAQPNAGLGDTSGWTTNSSTTTELRLAKTGNVAAPSGAAAVTFSAVTNPSTTNSTFFVRITTFSDATWTTPIDTGTVASSTATQIQVSLSVDETLTFCTGTSITGTNCGTATGSAVNLGTGSTTATSTGTSILAASTNGPSGYTITVNGNTLTSGSNTITALSAATAASVGSKQFGLNLVGNSSPSVGSAVSGSGTATAASNYNAANAFKYVTGDTVASIGGATNANTFTVSYIANIDGSTPSGLYQTTLTYVATPNF